MDTINSFITALNNYHPSIKFTANISNKEIQFLDIIVYKKDNQLHTKLYIKPSDNKQYLHYSSSHPVHMKHAIPFSQAIRYRRIITEEEELNTSLISLKQMFLNRAYPEDMVSKQIDRVKHINRQDTLDGLDEARQVLRELSPLPKASQRRSRKRKTETAQIITASPFKNQLENANKQKQEKDTVVVSRKTTSNTSKKTSQRKKAKLSVPATSTDTTPCCICAPLLFYVTIGSSVRNAMAGIMSRADQMTLPFATVASVAESTS